MRESFAPHSKDPNTRSHCTHLHRPNRIKHIAKSGTRPLSYCAMLEFEFVSVSHPDEIKDRKKQAKLRQHAIRNGIQKSKAERVKKNGVFVPIEVDGRTRQPVKRSPPKADSLTTAPSVSLLDPFNTLCGCPERLRNLMRHRACLVLPLQSLLNRSDTMQHPNRLNLQACLFHRAWKLFSRAL
jgi:hypothetical protein